MRRMAILTVAALALAGAPLALEAQGVESDVPENGLQVIGTASVFEVLTRAGAGKADYFCAAGRFAFGELGAAKADRLVVLAVRVPSKFRENRLAVVFGVNAPEPASKELQDTLRVGGPRIGQSASVGHSEALCSVK